MAILSEKTLPNGVVINYHRIMNVTIDYLNSQCNYTIGSYLTEEVRRSGLQPVQTQQFTLDYQNQVMPDNPREAFYLKALEPVKYAPPYEHPVVEGHEPLPPMPPMPIYNQVSVGYPKATAC